MFTAHPDETNFYCFRVRKSDTQMFESGRMRLAIGRLDFTSEITGYSGVYCYGVLHLGDQNVSAGVTADAGSEILRELAEQLGEPLQRADLPQVIRGMDQLFGSSMVTISSLFHDEQMKILNHTLSASLAEAEQAYQTMYEHNAPLMRFLGELNIPLPKAFVTAAEFALTGQLRRALAADKLDHDHIHHILREVKVEKLKLDQAELELTLRLSIERKATELMEHPESMDRLRTLEQAVSLGQTLPFEINNWKVQNIFYALSCKTALERRAKAAAGDAKARAWMELFSKLALELKMAAFLPPPLPAA